MFLYGMDLMGDGLKSSSATTLKNVLSKVTSNPFSGFLLGLFITSLIQSSTATIVICVGLIGAGMMTLSQAISITIGANVGTTITAQMIRLLDIDGAAGTILRMLKPDTLAPIALVVGMILIMAVKKDAAQNIGKIAVGFGILFIGILNMTNAMKPLATSEEFKNLIITLSDMPFVVFGVAAVFTAVIASSSATVGVLQTLCSTGVITMRLACFYVVGAAIGTCITTGVLCSIGTKAEARRVACVHIVYNFIGAIVFITGLEVLYHMGIIKPWLESYVFSGGVADMQTAYKLANALALLPFAKVLERLACRIVKDDVEDVKTAVPADRFDALLFNSPKLALEQCAITIEDMAKSVRENFDLAMKQALDYNEEIAKKLNDTEEYIDALTDRGSQYLVELSAYVEADNESDEIGDFLQAVSEFERIGDLAVNIQEIGQGLKEKQLAFSDMARREISVLSEVTGSIIDMANAAVCGSDLSAAKNVEPLEEVIDDLVEKARAGHVDRLKRGKCSVDGGIAFLDMLTNIERIGDQCSNLALMVIKRHNPEINKHEYIKRLHDGENTEFNKIYEQLKNKYLTALELIESEEDTATAEI